MRASPTCKGAAAVFLLLMAACAGQRSVAPVRVPDANFELTLREVVGTPEEDTEVYAEVFIDGRASGRTRPGRRSQEKRWQAKLDEGNRLTRFEIWDSTAPAARWPEDFQPRERFIRIEPGMRTKADLKFYDRGRQYDLQISREPR